MKKDKVTNRENSNVGANFTNEEIEKKSKIYNSDLALNEEMEKLREIDSALYLIAKNLQDMEHWLRRLQNE